MGVGALEFFGKRNPGSGKRPGFFLSPGEVQGRQAHEIWRNRLTLFSAVC